MGPDNGPVRFTLPRRVRRKCNRRPAMENCTITQKLWLGLLAGVTAVTVASSQASAQQQQRPNILFIMGDDVGFMQRSIYHQALMVGETPNVDRIGQEGAKFMDYLAMQSCRGTHKTHGL